MLDDALVHYEEVVVPIVCEVSILVVLDDALVLRQTKLIITFTCLNPCCAGRCSSTRIDVRKSPKTGSLNPCCAGRCSSTG